MTFFEEPALAGAAKTRAAKTAPNIGQAFKVRSPWHGSNRQDKNTFVGIFVGMQ